MYKPKYGIDDFDFFFVLRKLYNLTNVENACQFSLKLRLIYLPLCFETVEGKTVNEHSQNTNILLTCVKRAINEQIIYEVSIRKKK